MIKKKLLVVPVILALALLMVASGCGTGSSTPAEDPVSIEELDPTVLTSVDESEDAAAEPDAAEEDEVSAVMQDVAFEETVLVDDENCTFKITSINPNDEWGYTLKVLLENKTDADLMFSIDNVSVNGYMCDPFWAAEVTAGMKSNESIIFYSEDFAANGIVDPTEIEFTLSVYDYENWDEPNLVEDIFTIYPLGEEAVVEYEREPGADDIVLFDTEECTMIVTGTNPEGDWGYEMNVFLVNKTESTLMFSVDGAAINGFMCDPYWAEIVAPGKMCNSAITWDDYTLEENGIEDPQTFTLPVTVYDNDFWSTELFVDQTYTVEP